MLHAEKGNIKVCYCMSVSFRVSVGGPKCSDNEAVHFGSPLLEHYDGSTKGIKLSVIYFLLLHSVIIHALIIVLTSYVLLVLLLKWMMVVLV